MIYRNVTITYLRTIKISLTSFTSGKEGSRDGDKIERNDAHTEETDAELAIISRNFDERSLLCAYTVDGEQNKREMRRERASSHRAAAPRRAGSILLDPRIRKSVKQKEMSRA